MFRVVRLGGHKARKAPGNAVDAHDAADVFLYRDSSFAPLLDMRRRFKAVMDVLRNGVSLARSVELTAQCDQILCVLLLWMVLRVLDLLISVVLLVVFSMGLVTSSVELLYIVGMRLSGGGGIG